MRASNPLRPFLLQLACIVLVACATVPTAPDAVIRSPQDPREYRYLELPNHMRVVLVSDRETDQAAASLLVRAGSGNDPADRQGLAHFLEHMLFLGTQKYPDPGEYQEFVNAHGGSNNAYTGIDRTNYFFSVEPSSLEPALDRFAQFFIAPLFDPAYVEREANAVDSEYRMGLKDDSRREYDVLRELVDPRHPLAKLGVGNLQTLDASRGDLRGDLLAFHRRYYSAAMMTLVVLGRESLDELQSLVESRFAAVEDRGTDELHDVPPMFAAGTLPLEVQIRPEKELRELTLMFPVPSERAHYRAKPLEYIGNLVGHEGPGSLLSLLKERGWAEGLSAGAGLDLYGEDAFQVSVRLTPDGVEHHREVVSLALRTVQGLRDGIDAWRFDEQRDLAKLGFRFREKGSPVGAVIRLAEALQRYPVADAIRGPYVYSDWDPQLIARYLGYLRTDNLMVTLSHRDAATDRRSRWFDTPYGLKRLDAGELERAAAAVDAPLALPQPNEFVPHRLELKPLAQAHDRPQLLVDTPEMRLWHLQDASFGVPKASVMLQLLSPVPGRSPRDAALAVLHARLVNDALNEYAYPATLAGLAYGVEAGTRGLTVQVEGYDDRQSLLLDRILQTLLRERFDPERFAAMRTELMRDWANSARRRPYDQLFDEMRVSLVERSYPDRALREALATLGPDDLARYIGELRSALSLEVLVHGNDTADEALALARHARRALGSPPAADVPPIEIAALGRESLARELDIDHPDSALLLYVQGADSSDAERARMALDAQILGAAFFNDLRTEQQLGYVVFAQNNPLYRIPGLVFVVQSPVAAPRALAAAFNAFFDSQRTVAGELDDAAFQRHRRSLAEKLREKPKSLGEASQRFWSEIRIGAYDFGDRERIATAVEQVGRAEWLQHFQDEVAAPDRRGMWFWSEGNASKGTTGSAPAGRAVSADWPAGQPVYRFDRPERGERSESSVLPH